MFSESLPDHRVEYSLMRRVSGVFVISRGRKPWTFLFALFVTCGKFGRMKWRPDAVIDAKQNKAKSEIVELTLLSKQRLASRRRRLIGQDNVACPRSPVV